MIESLSSSKISWIFTLSVSIKKGISVTQLNRSVKDLLDRQLGPIWVEGEISNISVPSSGHWYFSLKDNTAQVRCAMFRGRNSQVAFRPKVGDKVLVYAQATIYEGRGDFQLIVNSMQSAGQGDLQQQFDALKAKLFQEGLFDDDGKQALPQWPKRLGVITSATGAALQDVLHVLKRRCPMLEVLILPVAVQGKDSAQQLTQAVITANTHDVCDVLLLTRGGGSMEDLWSFNDEALARAIYASRIPVVSAVGHEIDFTIADFVADLRAPTPSAAAEIISPDSQQLGQLLETTLRALQHHIRQTLQLARSRLQALTAELRHPGHTLQMQQQTLDQLELRMQRALASQLQEMHSELQYIENRLNLCEPKNIIEDKRQRLCVLIDKLHQCWHSKHKEASTGVQHAAALLHNLSPLNTLQRGYAIVQNQQGIALRSASQVSVGEKVSARLNDGTLLLQVQGIHR